MSPCERTIPGLFPKMIFILNFFLLCHASSDLGKQLLKHDLVKTDSGIEYTSPFFCPKEYDNNPFSHVNEKQMLRTICYLDHKNPYLRITRKELLNEASADPQLDVNRILNLFSDGMGVFLWNREMHAMTFGDAMIFTTFAILDAVIALRKNRPADCPIPGDKLDELLELLLIMELSAENAYRAENGHVNNKAIIEGMKQIGERRFLAAVGEGHGWTVEVRKEQNDQYLVTHLNSGQGLENHRVMNNRYEYFAQYRLSLKEIADLQYFVNSRRRVPDMYPKSGRIDSPISVTDFIGTQKLGTCHVKGINMALKWFFRELDPSNATYLWWKAWHLTYRIPQIKELLQGVSASLIINGSSRYPLSTLIIHHHVKRLRGAANNPPSVLTGGIMQMLDIEEGNVIINTIQPAGRVDHNIDRLHLITWDHVIRVASYLVLLIQLMFMPTYEMDWKTLLPIAVLFISAYVLRDELFRWN